MVFSEIFLFDDLRNVNIIIGGNGGMLRGIVDFLGISL